MYLYMLYYSWPSCLIFSLLNTWQLLRPTHSGHCRPTCQTSVIGGDRWWEIVTGYLCPWWMMTVWSAQCETCSPLVLGLTRIDSVQIVQCSQTALVQFWPDCMTTRNHAVFLKLMSLCVHEILFDLVHITVVSSVLSSNEVDLLRYST